MHSDVERGNFRELQRQLKEQKTKIRADREATSNDGRMKDENAKYARATKLLYQDSLRHALQAVLRMAFTRSRPR